MNVLSAAVDYELVVRNQGAAEARGVRIALQLFTAGEHHDAELRDYLDAPVDAPIVAAFDLAPGAAKTVRDRKSPRRTPGTNAHLVCRLLLGKKKHNTHKK